MIDVWEHRRMCVSKKRAAITHAPICCTSRQRLHKTAYRKKALSGRYNVTGANGHSGWCGRAVENTVAFEVFCFLKAG